MDIIAQFLKLVDAYAAATGLAESTVSTRLFNDGKRVAALRARTGDIGIMKIRTALQWLSANWPEGKAWPSGVARPDPDRRRAAG